MNKFIEDLFHYDNELKIGEEVVMLDKDKCIYKSLHKGSETSYDLNVWKLCSTTNLEKYDIFSAEDIPFETGELVVLIASKDVEKGYQHKYTVDISIEDIDTFIDLHTVHLSDGSELNNDEMMFMNLIKQKQYEYETTGNISF